MLGDNIKNRREELGLTLQEVGEYIGVSKATVQRYESGEIKNLKLVTIERLTQVLKINPVYLMGWEDNDRIFGFNGDSEDVFNNYRELTSEDKEKAKAFLKFLHSQNKSKGDKNC